MSGGARRARFRGSSVATIEPYDTKQGRRYRILYRTPERRQTTKRGFATKRNAERFARTVEVAKDRGEFINPADSAATVGELGAGWIKTQTHLKASSHRPVESAWRIHVEPRWAP